MPPILLVVSPVGPSIHPTHPFHPSVSPIHLVPPSLRPTVDACRPQWALLHRKYADCGDEWCDDNGLNKLYGGAVPGSDPPFQGRCRDTVTCRDPDGRRAWAEAAGAVDPDAWVAARDALAAGTSSDLARVGVAPGPTGRPPAGSTWPRPSPSAASGALFTDPDVGRVVTSLLWLVGEPFRLRAARSANLRGDFPGLLVALLLALPGIPAGFYGVAAQWDAEAADRALSWLLLVWSCGNLWATWRGMRLALREQARRFAAAR